MVVWLLDLKAKEGVLFIPFTRTIACGMKINPNAGAERNLLTKAPTCRDKVVENSGYHRETEDASCSASHLSAFANLEREVQPATT